MDNMNLMTIREFTDSAWEELEDAMKYIRLAEGWKEFDRPIADKYFEMANQELSHFDILKSMARKIVEENIDDDNLRFVWDWMHDNLMDKLASISQRMSMYRK